MNLVLKKWPESTPKPMLMVQVFLITLIVIGVILLFTQKLWLPTVVNYILTQENSTTVAKGDRVEDFDLKNAVLVIEGESVSLIDGVSESSIASSSDQKVVTRYLGNEAMGDLDGDGMADVIFLVTQETGGSGVFYYILAALRDPQGYTITNAVLVGDRILPQATYIKPGSGELQVKFLKRREDEPMTNEPTIEGILSLKVDESGYLEQFSTDLEWGIY